MNIRPVQERDFPAIITLLNDFAAFQKVPGAVHNSVEQMQREQEHFKCFVAEDEQGGIAGIASYFIAYYTWAGKSLYLDDLYVAPAFRGQHIGSRLLNAVFDVARQQQCNRVRWQVSNWNHDAIVFYQKCGAHIEDGILNCDSGPDVIANFNLTI
ncbi:GNAT family N-acetyltransferase [uncultured Chitinophaga sp.]|uniref:GNAT family N-acetyltransferase n=1 Tax=uncultured Chitinophaga sp. TaxID=339340 RepID=UPI0025D34C52|nr:GNAT family N-acetyltransferase [uncultured Chitinophaga sp.]